MSQCQAGLKADGSVYAACPEEYDQVEQITAVCMHEHFVVADLCPRHAAAVEDEAQCPFCKARGLDDEFRHVCKLRVLVPVVYRSSE